MKSNKYIFFIQVILFFTLISISCKTDTDSKSSPVIEISPHFSDNSFIFEDVFQSVDIIPLETNSECLIGGITKLVEANDSYYILDGVNNIVAKFDREGKFITKIGALGNGPGEYLKIEDIIVDKDSQTIKLYDIRGRKIIIYDFDGSYIREFRLHLFLKSIANAENGYFWGFIGNTTNSREIQSKKTGELKFIKFDEKGKIVDKIFGREHSEIHLPFFEHMSPQKDGSISFVEPLQNQIFKLKNNEISSHYKIKFNSCSVPKEIRNILNQNRTPLTTKQKNTFSEANRNYILGFIQFYENNNWIILQYSVKYRFQFAFYHKPTGKLFESSGLPWSTTTANLFFTPSYIDDKFIYSNTSSFYLYERYKEEQDDNKIEEKRINSWNILLKDIKINDNPIIFKYKLQKGI